MKQFCYLLTAVVCLVLTGCGVNSSSYPNSNGNTNVVIRDGHFRYLKKVTGECEQTYIFGFGGLTKGSLENNAIQDMYDNANLKDGQVIINITTTVSSQIYFPVVFTKRRAMAYGMVIEFTEDAESYADERSYESWEKSRYDNVQRVSAEPAYGSYGNNVFAQNNASTQNNVPARNNNEEAEEEENDVKPVAAVAAVGAGTAASTEGQAKAVTYPTTDRYTFTVADGRKVVFAPGNLRYNASDRKWLFADNQYAVLGTKNSPSGVLDLFCWGTGDRPTSFTKFATDFSSYEEWGRNTIVNGGDNQWRTLTSNEWYYLLNKRDEAKSRFTLAMVGDVSGMLILPDNLKLPMKNRFIPGNGGTKASDNKYSIAQWKKMEEKGCVFLPIAGYADNGKASKTDSAGNYWTASSGTAVSFGKDYLYARSTTPNNRGCSVRLVREAR